MKKTLLVMMTFLPEFRAILEALAPELDIVYCEKQPPTEEDLKRASYIWGNPSEEQLSLCERLEWLQLQTAGHDRYVLPGVLPKGAMLCNCSGAYGLAISEFLLAHTLVLMRKLHLYRDLQHEHSWSHLGRIGIVARSSVLVVGIGDIGARYAQKMHALGARVFGIRRQVDKKPDYLEALYRMDQIDDILPQCDIVALCLPNHPETEGLFNRERIAKMKQGAFLLNVGRGSAVDTEALCDALESGALAGAGLDVVEPEPLPENHRLWNIKTAMITPHCAGGDQFGEIYPSIIEVWCENLRRLQADEPMLNRVDIETGYRV
ncbi:phosphoglycerate dehydrogenase-like enzyme [Paenibacillus rhizosphaerae]|uniref:Phosphoglycerate dehydrogenase-like enzyme n=1 Tax=Paenibacillus rhizosphaerae TaxID=297318 RepID=A0A839TQZ7_9BACL|nr:D-2-hydroxyacid dehydrogenase [Paenibacillus rhizosphaerae]MBB3129142.1 phosphoglycerate dehydrogenase-like enzyme [Paenibacillus rhizosphaerae]